MNQTRLRKFAFCTGAAVIILTSSLIAGPAQAEDASFDVSMSDRYQIGVTATRNT